MVDGQLHVNRKVNSLAEAALDNDLIGIAALGHWTAAGAACQPILSDGLISVNGLEKILLNKEAVDLLAARLFEVGLWHTDGHDCERCPPVAARSFLFHDWKSMGISGKAMSKDLLTAGDDAAKAFEKITGGLQKIKDPSKQASVALALFGTPLEDIGKDRIPGFLKALTGAEADSATQQAPLQS